MLLIDTRVGSNRKKQNNIITVFQHRDLSNVLKLEKGRRREQYEASYEDSKVKN